MNEQVKSEDTKGRKFKWPWFVLAALLLGILLAFLWMSREVEKTRRQRDFNHLNGM